MALVSELQQNLRGVISTSTHGLTRDAHASNGPYQAVTAIAQTIPAPFPISRAIWRWVWLLRLSNTKNIQYDYDNREI